MTQSASLSACEICETMLDITGVALERDDFDAFATCFNLPLSMRTEGGQTMVTTREDMKLIFDRIVRQYKTMGVTEMVRVCESAEFVSATQIKATHVTYLLRHGTHLKDPYPVLSLLNLIDGDWRVVSSDYDLEANSAQSRALLSTAADRNS